MPNESAPEGPESPPYHVVLPMVNGLDRAIVLASKADRATCNAAEVLQTIVEPTIDIYHICEPWGIYRFPLTKRVYAWFHFLVSHSELVIDEDASMDWTFFDDPVFIATKYDTDGKDGGDEQLVEEGGEEDGVGESETDDEYEDTNGMEVEGETVEGDGDKASARVANRDGGVPVGTKRKSSNPAPGGNDLPIPAKRSRTGSKTEEKSREATAPPTLKDEPSQPDLTLYPVPCARCVTHSTVCYMQSGNSKKAKACDRCRALKRHCTYGDDSWVSTLPTNALDRIQKEWDLAAKRHMIKSGKKKAGVQVPKVDRVDGKEKLKGKATDKEVGRVTRSKSKEVPQPPNTPSHPVYSLTGNTIGTHSTVVRPKASTPSSRQPSPRRFETRAPLDTANDGVTPSLTKLFETATRLDGDIADTQGQLRALTREVERMDGFRDDVAQLKQDWDDVRDEIEEVRASVTTRFETTTTLIGSLDQTNRLNVFQARTDRELGELVVAREGLERTQTVVHERLDGLVARVGGIEESLASVRRDAVDGNGERMTRMERSITGLQDEVRRVREEGSFPPQAMAALLQGFEDGLRRHEDRLARQLGGIEQYLHSLDQRFHAAEVLMAQQPVHNPPFLIPRQADSTVSPKAIFPAAASSSTHFVAEMPRTTAPSGQLSHNSWTTPMSALERRYTNFGTMSGSSGRPSQSGSALHGLPADILWINHDHASDVSGEIVPPVGFTGGKSGRRPGGDNLSARSRSPHASQSPHSPLEHAPHCPT